jgi:hypothetical protein
MILLRASISGKDPFHNFKLVRELLFRGVICMRSALAIVVATLMLGLISQPMLAQVHVDVPALQSIHMTDTLAGWAVTREQDRSSGGLGNALLHTIDGPIRWRDVTPLSRSERQPLVTAFAVLTSRIAWISIQTPGDADAPFRIFHTVDGGRTWRSVRVSTFGVSSIHFVNSQNGWAITDAVGYMGGGEEVNIYRSTDGGDYWIRIASACIRGSAICENTPENEDSGLPLYGYKVDITFLSAMTGWITGSIFYVTHTAGRSWREQTLPLPAGVTSSWHRGYSPPAFFSAQEGIMPVFYISNQSTPPAAIAVYYATRDGGGTWKYTEPISITPDNLACWHITCRRFRPSSFADMNHGWMTDGDTLYMTRDGGRQWTTARLPLFSEVRDLQFISPQVGWAVRQTFPFLLKTTDGGYKWELVPYAISRQ